jgi:Tol biopolymer transport system component
MSSDRIALVVAVALLAALPCAGPTTERVTGSWSGGPERGWRGRAHLTADGRFVTFDSESDDLVPDDANRFEDVFVRDRSTGVIEIASLDSSGRPGNGHSFGGSTSGDGRFVAFASRADDLVRGDMNGVCDVFVHDRSNGATTLVSALPSGVQGNGDSTDPVISDDGRFVAFVSVASNLDVHDPSSTSDVFVANLMTRQIRCVSLTPRGRSGDHASGIWGGPSISADGQVVAFASNADDLVAHDHNLYWDVFVRDLGTGQTRRVDVGRLGGEANYGAEYPSISADGQVVAFESFSWNLVAGDTNRLYDVFVCDLRSGVTERVSVDSSGAQAKGGGGGPMISPDGNVVAFTSSSDDLVPGDNNDCQDAFVHDRTTGLTERVSVDTQGNEVRGSSDTYRLRAVSSDGGLVGFESASDAFVIGDRNRSNDVFIRVR